MIVRSLMLGKTSVSEAYIKIHYFFHVLLIIFLLFRMRKNYHLSIFFFDPTVRELS
jgi:hypothetical protein